MKEQGSEWRGVEVALPGGGTSLPEMGREKAKKAEITGVA